MNIKFTKNIILIQIISILVLSCQNQSENFKKEKKIKGL